MEFNKEELIIIKKAINEYEENYFSSEGKIWQNTINKLISKLKEVL